MTDRKQAKQHAQERFGATATNYVNSPVHAHGTDLPHLMSLIQVQEHWSILDVATGAGHTAAALMPACQRVIASDLTLPMLRQTRTQYPELLLCGADAENLPFKSQAFDLITCRFAAHHFPTIFQFFQTCSRALKTGGLLAVIDHLAPDDPLAAHYIDAFETLRDPSHVKTYNIHEWQGLMLDTGFEITHSEIFTASAGGINAWAARQHQPDDVISKLHIMLALAPDAVKEFLQPTAVGTPEADFLHTFVMILGRKTP